jgi:hypothetical protein
MSSRSPLEHLTATATGSPNPMNGPVGPILTIRCRPDGTAHSRAGTDVDHLSDQDEAVYGTDPENPDTDGDSVPDGDEVAQGTSPLA